MRSLWPCAAVLALMMQAASASGVKVQAAWARATLPGQDEGAVYLSLTSDQADTLLGVSSPDAGEAMLHRATRRGSMSGMEDVNSLPVAAGQTVVFAPHGLHVMLMGLKHPLAAGATVRLSLRFAQAGTVAVSVPVRPVGFTGEAR